MSNLFHSLIHKSTEGDNSLSSYEEDSYNSYGEGNKKRLSKPEMIAEKGISGVTEEKIEDMIPINENKFNNSKISRTITFETVLANEVERQGIRGKKFEIAKSSVVTTYVINDMMYSQFTNPNDIQSDRRVRVFILERDANDDKFIYDINDILSTLCMESENAKNVNDFLTGMNKFFDDSTYLQIKNKNHRNKLLLLISIIFFLFIVISTISYITYTIFVSSFTTMSLLSSSTLILLFIFLSLYQYNSLKNIHIYSTFNIVSYMVMNYSTYVNYVESWNRSIFFSNRIRVSIPLTIDYILFNLDPYQYIKIKHNVLIPIDEVNEGNINTVRETQMSQCN